MLSCLILEANRVQAQHARDHTWNTDEIGEGGSTTASLQNPSRKSNNSLVGRPSTRVMVSRGSKDR